MRSEKEFLVREVFEHLSKSDYVYLADFSGVTVSGISLLRKNLKSDDAECHIVKNSILRVALQRTGCVPLNDKCFEGHTAVVIGGANPSGVAKLLFKFAKDNDGKMVIKGGILSKNPLEIEEIKALSELPSLEVLRSKILALFEAPAQHFVCVLNAVPQEMINVLQAKSKNDE